jgi:uncharacterized UPF0146 family protein
MDSSYKSSIDYCTLIEGITLAVRPRKVVEIGILKGFSLECFRKSSGSSTEIKAYDIFEEFNGNHGDKESLQTLFAPYDNVSVGYGDFYKIHKTIENVDIIHIDIANNGDVYEYAIQNYLPKLTDNGVMILEGGSPERDNVEWMNKYRKPKISPVVEKYGLSVLGTFPSITIARKRT